MPHPSTSSAYGIWSLNEIRDAVRGDNWPGPPFSGATETFTYTGADQTYTVPAGATSITFKVWGGAGGSSNKNGVVYGGAGGFTQGTLAVSGGETLTIVVGGGGEGTGATTGTSAYGGGGQTSGAVSSDNRRGSGGGGYSGVFDGSISQANAIIIAGGGGGSSGGYIGHGGPGAYPDGINAGLGWPTDGGENGVGKGGSQSAGGAGGTDGRETDGNNGSALQGGNFSADSSNFYNSNGTGGGGYFGGGSGANYYNGGGGGSGYLDGSLTSTSNANSPRPSATSGDTTGAVAPNTSDTDYVAGVAAAVQGDDGNNGLVVLVVS